MRATLAFGGAALKGVWNGTFAGVPLTRDMLKAYAQTHGYTFDDVVNRPYDIIVTPEVKDAGGNITAYAKYNVFLPIYQAHRHRRRSRKPAIQAAVARYGCAGRFRHRAGAGQHGGGPSCSCQRCPVSPGGLRNQKGPSDRRGLFFVGCLSIHRGSGHAAGEPQGCLAVHCGTTGDAAIAIRRQSTSHSPSIFQRT